MLRAQAQMGAVPLVTAYRAIPDQAQRHALQQLAKCHKPVSQIAVSIFLLVGIQPGKPEHLHYWPIRAHY